jgi:hypothetical protein
MDIAHKKKRKEARKLFLAGECASNADIGRRLGLKPHTVSRYRKEEDWDGLRLKAERRAAEKMVEQLANERVSLNTKHYNFHEVILNEVTATLKAGHGKFTAADLADLVGIVERAQKGQRLARGLSVTGETEEQIRAQAEADHRGLVDAFTEAVKQHVPDEELRERIGAAVMARFPGAEATDSNPEQGAA